MAKQVESLTCWMNLSVLSTSIFHVWTFTFFSNTQWTCIFYTQTSLRKKLKQKKLRKKHNKNTNRQKNCEFGLLA